MSYSRRSLLGGAAAVGAGLALVRVPQAVAQAITDGPALTPEQFGAKGDGATNDTAAFARLGAAISAAGGGTVALRKTTYIVGSQRPAVRRDALFSFEPLPVLEIEGCTGPVTIRGNGARLRCADNLRYGTFDPIADQATSNPMPFAGSQIATPYRSMIQIARCSGPIDVSDLELDGNVDRLRLGGQYGDTGHQIPAWGLALLDNRGLERIRNIYTHHHGQDGFYIDGPNPTGRPPPERRIVNLRSEYNARQGCSIVGGHGYRFEDCRFNHTGRSKSGLRSAPGAGVDIEAEGDKVNRDHSFLRCEFVDNNGCGMVADSGDSEGALFRDCTFIGTTAWAVWPNKPRFRFHNCLFVGASVRAFGDPDERRAAQFHDCRFRDDPKLSPTGTVAMGGEKHYPIYDLSSEANVLFNRCDFLLTHNGKLPWSWYALYQDCRMRQSTNEQGYPKGKYRGRSAIEGNVDLYGTTVEGTLTVNGRPFV